MFLGTSHIAEQSLNDVKKFIEAGKPDIIALELDKKRLLALMQKQRKIEIRIIRKVGIKGFLFLLFGAWAEKKLGKLVGVAPGSEMKTAITLARKHGIKIFLIDRDIEVTLRRLSKVLTWKEKVNFIADIIKAVFTGKQEFEFDLRTVPEKSMIKKLVEKLKERYPNVHKVLIEERNLVIAENLKRLMAENTNDKILVILGAGHVDEVMRLVKRKNGIGLGYSFSV